MSRNTCPELPPGAQLPPVTPMRPEALRRARLLIVAGGTVSVVGILVMVVTLVTCGIAER